MNTVMYNSRNCHFVYVSWAVISSVMVKSSIKLLSETFEDEILYCEFSCVDQLMSR